MDQSLFELVSLIPLIIPSCIVLGLLYNTFYQSTRYFTFARLAEDMPTANIHSAAQGYRELSGETENLFPEPLISPLTKTPCLWYLYSVEKYVGGKNSSWELVEDGVSERVFLIRDATGKCIVDPHLAEVSTALCNTWYGAELRPSEPPPAHEPGFVVIGRDKRYRYTEQRIEAGESLYVIANFSSHMEVPSHIKNKGTRQIIRQWKTNQDNLLKAFDQNDDGRIDNKEWQRAQRLASHIAIKKMTADQHETHLHLASKPQQKSKPFILSSKAEPDMVAGYRKSMIYSLVAFLAALLFAANLLSKFNA